jgi:hypothetical protein
MIVLDALRILSSAVFALFLPGFVWSFVFFRKREIDWVERIALAFGLSIAIVPLTVFWLDWLFEVRITVANASITAFALMAVPAAYLWVTRPTLRQDLTTTLRRWLDTGAGACSPPLQAWLRSVPASAGFKLLRRRVQRSIDLLLAIEPLWVGVAGALVFVSNLFQWGACLSWAALVIAVLPLLVRLIRQGAVQFRTPFDLSIALFLVGAVVGLAVSPRETISLGAFQCILAVSMFYYSWVNHPQLASWAKWAIPAGFFAVLGYALSVAVESSGSSGEAGSADCTYHGLALCLLIIAIICVGIVAFGRGARSRVAAALTCLFLFVAVFLLVGDSLPRLFSWESVDGRLPRWGTTLDLLGDSPFSGLGLGCWAFAYHGSEVIAHPTHVHNAYLELCANTGLLGVAAFALSLAIGLRLALDIIKCPRGHPWRGFGIGVLLACLATLLVGVLESAPVGVPRVGADDYRYIISPIPWILGGLLVSAHRLLCREA